MKRLEFVIDRLLKPMSYKFGIIETRLRCHWTEVMPITLAAHSQPVKVIYNKFDKTNTLYIKVNNGGSALAIQYLIPSIVENIAKLFGYKIVHAIKIKQEIKFECQQKL